MKAGPGGRRQCHCRLTLAGRVQAAGPPRSVAPAPFRPDNEPLRLDFDFGVGPGPGPWTRRPGTAAAWANKLEAAAAAAALALA